MTRVYGARKENESHVGRRKKNRTKRGTRYDEIQRKSVIVAKKVREKKNATEEE